MQRTIVNVGFPRVHALTAAACSIPPFSTNHRMISINLHGSDGNNDDDDYTYTPIPSGNKSSKRKKAGQTTPATRKGVGRQSYRFVDRIRVRASGGEGGKGSLSVFRIGRKHKRRPDGGHGGHGGSVIIVADPKEQNLRWTNPHVTAKQGTNGSSQKKHGRNGKNLVIRVPCGVVVRRVLDYDEQWDPETKNVYKIAPIDLDELDEQSMHDDDRVHNDSFDSDDDDFDSDTNDEDEDEDSTSDDEFSEEDTEELISDEHDEDEHTADNYYYDEAENFTAWGEREKVTIADLDKPGSFCIVAKGGKGGTGTSIFGSMNGPLPPQEVLSRKARPAPGERAALELELKMIADVGLVGFPNAGKSSLLAAMSRATPEIAPYPFTTLHPLVGYIEYKDGFRVCAADVPGLIAGASEGKGKGHDFLRHLERTKALLYIVDAAGVDGRDPIEDLKILTNELSCYSNGIMMNRPALLVANKMDLLDKTGQLQLLEELQKIATDMGVNLEHDAIGISAGVTGEGLASLSKVIRRIVTTSDAQQLTQDL